MIVRIIPGSRKRIIRKHGKWSVHRSDRAYVKRDRSLRMRRYERIDRTTVYQKYIKTNVEAPLSFHGTLARLLHAIRRRFIERKSVIMQIIAYARGQTNTDTHTHTHKIAGLVCISRVVIPMYVSVCMCIAHFFDHFYISGANAVSGRFSYGRIKKFH